MRPATPNLPPPSNPWPISRRSLLKSLGVLTLGSCAATVPLPPFLATAWGQSGSGEPWQVALASPLFHHFLAELKQAGHHFLLTPNSFVSVAESGNLVALTLRHTQSPSPRTGTDLVLTVDMQQGQLVAAQYLRGVCLDGSLHISSAKVDRRISHRQATSRGDVRSYVPRSSRFWTFARAAEDIPPPPDPLPLEGWPPELPGACYWHYRGCTQTVWREVEGFMIRLGAHVVEESTCAPGTFREFDLL
ncbi:MAG: hypothetical protein ACRDIB_19805 [Ardenticatenaceae bacterium]